MQHLLNYWCCFNIFCKRYGDITEHTAEICCYGTQFLLYQVLTKKSIFGAPMIELAYFLHTKLFVAAKDSYHSKKLEMKVIWARVCRCTFSILNRLFIDPYRHTNVNIQTKCNKSAIESLSYTFIHQYQ